MYLANGMYALAIGIVGIGTLMSVGSKDASASLDQVEDVALSQQAPEERVAQSKKGSEGATGIKAQPLAAKVGNSTSRRRGETGYSGPRGDEDDDVNIGENNGRHVYGLKWSERNDKPCYIDVFTGGFVRGSFEPLTRDGEVHGSECKVKKTSTKEITFGMPTGGEYWAVDGVKVCLNKKGTRLKGIKLYAEKVDKGDLTGATTSKSVERTNCADWQSAKKCPDGQIASELNFGWSNGAITSIELECSEYGWE